MNGIESLLSSYASGLSEGIQGVSNESGVGNANFSDVFSDIYDLAERTEIQNKESVGSLLTGDVDDISDVMIDSEKAEIALSLTIEIRNKILDAYNEIMNMQV